MCIKAGTDELNSVCNMAGMALTALLCDVFARDFDAFAPDQHLVRDLNMNTTQALALATGISDLFDGLQIDLSSITTVGALEKHIQKTL